LMSMIESPCWPTGAGGWPCGDTSDIVISVSAGRAPGANDAEVLPPGSPDDRLMSPPVWAMTVAVERIGVGVGDGVAVGLGVFVAVGVLVGVSVTSGGVGVSVGVLVSVAVGGSEHAG